MIFFDILIYTYFISCIFIIAYAFFKDRDNTKIQLGNVSKFVGFMTIVTMIRLCINSMSSYISDIPSQIQMSNFLIVFLEDAFFVMIPYYICKKINYKPLKVLIWTLFSLLFASGHVYQGLFVALITGFYPYFISRKYAEKTTFATVMVCHFLYDCMTFLTVKLSIILKYV